VHPKKVIGEKGGENNMLGRGRYLYEIYKIIYALDYFENIYPDFRVHLPFRDGTCRDQTEGHYRLIGQIIHESDH